MATRKSRHNVSVDEDGRSLYIPRDGVLDDPYGGWAPRDLDVFSSSAVQRLPLGTRLEFGDGRVYRYAKMGATVGVAGNLYQAKAPLANHNNRTATAAYAAGATSVALDVGATAASANDYAGGYLHWNDVAPEGHAHQIKTSAAAAGSDSLAVVLWETDALKAAATTSSEGTLTFNRWSAVIIHPSPPTAVLAGVTPWAVTAAHYFWMQVRGPAAVLTQGTLVIGDFCVPSATVDGAVMPSAAFETDGPYVGIVRSVNADTEYSLIDLQLE